LLQFGSADAAAESTTKKLMNLFVCLLLNGTSALFRPLVPRMVEKEHTNHVKKRFEIDKLIKKKRC